MGKGYVSAMSLLDIANAIRVQGGSETHYKPADMAAAVAALDGTKAGTALEEPFLTGPSRGLVESSELTAIADAIRKQNGSETKYKPAAMAQAILDLTWASTPKARAVLLADGTMELNYFDTVRASDGSEVTQAWELPSEAYENAFSAGWSGCRSDIKKVRFDPSFADSGIT